MTLPKALASALKWPPFLFSVFCLYWSGAILTITYRLKWLNFTKKRNDVLAWLVFKTWHICDHFESPTNQLLNLLLVLSSNSSSAARCYRCKGMKEIHKFTVLKVGSRELYRNTCMYLVRRVANLIIYFQKYQTPF